MQDMYSNPSLNHTCPSLPRDSTRYKPEVSKRLAEQPLDVLAAATVCELLIRRIAGKLELVLKVDATELGASHREPSLRNMEEAATARCNQEGQEILSQGRGYLMVTGD